MLTILVTIIHVIMCLILIAIVLLQSGKGASMGAAFGGGSNTLFGSTGPASFLNKVTTIAAIVFMITSFTLAIVSSRGGVSSSRVLDEIPTEETQPADQEDEQPAAVGATQGTAETTSDVPASTEAPETASSEVSVSPEDQAGEGDDTSGSE